MSVSKSWLAATAITGLLMIGCASQESTAPMTSPGSGTDPAATSSASPPLPSAPLTPSVDPPPATSEPSEEPLATSASSSSLSLLEQDLVFGLRTDAQIDCAPRRSDLPSRAIAGVECRVGSDLVDRIGIYAFSSQADALLAYRTRLDSVGVALRSGHCGEGVSGDSAWTPGDGPEYGGDLPYRLGCYRDENDRANIRLTCWGGERGGVYIGVLGATADIADLVEWVWRWPEGATNAYTPSSPRICNDQGVGPGPDPDFPGIPIQ